MQPVSATALDTVHMISYPVFDDIGFARETAYHG